MRRVTAAFLLLAIALTGCELRGEISVSDDGSGTFAMVFGAERRFLAMMGGPGATDPFESMRRDLADDPVKWTVTEYTRGDVRGVRATFAFSSIADLKEKMRAMSTQKDRQSAFGDFTLEQRNGGWIFSGAPADPADLSNDAPFPPEKLDELLDLQLAITLPGKAASSNADEARYSDGRTTFVWRPRLADAARGPKPLEARTVPATGGATLPLVPLALGGLLLAGIAAVAIASRRRIPEAAQTVFYMEPHPGAVTAGDGEQTEEPRPDETVGA